jgi:hypothetical protein
MDFIGILWRDITYITNDSWELVGNCGDVMEIFHDITNNNGIYINIYV